MEKICEELRAILEAFAASGWEELARPAQRFLNGDLSRAALKAAVAQAREVCGNCGCALDKLYPRALALL